MVKENDLAYVDSTRNDDEIDSLDGNDEVEEPIDDPLEDDVYFAPGPPLDGYPDDDEEVHVLYWRRSSPRTTWSPSSSSVRAAVEAELELARR